MVDEFSAATLEIELHPPGLIEIVGVTENRLVLIAGVNGTGDELVMFGVITGFDVRLWIDIQMRRPVHKSDGQQIRFLRQDPDFCPENPFVRLKPTKYRDLAPGRQPHLGLQLVRIGDALILNLETQREIAFLLQIRRDDLAKAFGRGVRERRRCCQKYDGQAKASGTFHLNPGFFQ